MLCNPCYSSRISNSLSVEGFLSVLRRFISRTGKLFRIFCDNGRNFVGTHSTLKDLGMFLKEQQVKLGKLFTEEGIQWSFIPAYSPHFRGLWEVGIKSVKLHSERSLGNALLTYEAFSSILCQIEGILNSPLTPLSSDLSDYEALTPFHFLIGRRLTSPPDLSIWKLRKIILDITKNHKRFIKFFGKCGTRIC